MASSSILRCLGSCRSDMRRVRNRHSGMLSRQRLERERICYRKAEINERQSFELLFGTAGELSRLIRVDGIHSVPSI